MSTQHLYHAAVAVLGAQACLNAGARAAGVLLESIGHSAQRKQSLDALARHVAEMEVACEQLRLVAGSGLVDLHKVSAFARLQSQVRDAESKGSTR